MKNTSLTAFAQHGYKIKDGAGAIEPDSGLNFVAVTALKGSEITTTTTDTDRFPNPQLCNASSWRHYIWELE